MKLYQLDQAYYDPRTAQILKDEGPPEQLTQRESKVLNHLISKHDEYVTVEELAVAAWGKRKWPVNDAKANVRDIIGEIRKKIGTRFIETSKTKGRGYRFVASPIEQRTSEGFNTQTTKPKATLDNIDFPIIETLRDWYIVEHLGEKRTAPNKVRYQVLKLYKPSLQRWERGKWYDPRDLPTKEQQEFEVKHRRHHEACIRVKNHDHLPHVIDAFQHEIGSKYDGYWVIDEWIEGDTLRTLRERGKIPNDTLLNILLDVAKGLKHLHEVPQGGIIRRDLAPENIIIRASDGRAVLTDLETAKFLDDSQSASPFDNIWRENLYRAPEATHRYGKTDKRIDLYSWAAVLVYAATGGEPSTQEEWVVLLDAADLPKNVKHIARRCLGTIERRPSSIDQVLHELSPFGKVINLLAQTIPGIAKLFG